MTLQCTTTGGSKSCRFRPSLRVALHQEMTTPLRSCGWNATVSYLSDRAWNWLPLRRLAFASLHLGRYFVLLDRLTFNGIRRHVLTGWNSPLWNRTTLQSFTPTSAKQYHACTKPVSPPKSSPTPARTLIRPFANQIHATRGVQTKPVSESA